MAPKHARTTHVHGRKARYKTESRALPTTAYLTRDRSEFSAPTRMKFVRNTVAGPALAIGLVVVCWAGWAYSVAAEGGDADVAPAGWAIVGTVGMIVGGGFIYLGWRAHRQWHKLHVRN